MIVRCPECTTGFKLPAAKIPDKGAKVRCSKCNHTFRVRVGHDGEPEIFYRNREPADPPTRELSDCLDEVNNQTQLGAAARAGGLFGDAQAQTIDEDFGNRTQIGRPTVSTPSSKSASADYDPFPFAGKASSSVEEESAAPDAPEVDPFDSDEPDPIEDPFGGAFSEDELGATVEMDAADRHQLETKSRDDSLLPDVPAPAPVFDAPEPEVDEAAQTQKLPDGPGFFGSSTSSDFGDPAQFVDDEFGKSGPYFDPEVGKVEQSVQIAPEASSPPREPASGTPDAARASVGTPAGQHAPPPNGARPPTTASGTHRPYQPASPPSASHAAPKPAEQKSEAPKLRAKPQVEDWDVAPHRIGGSTSRKVINTIFIVLLVSVAFLAVVTARAGGFIDFQRFGHMLEVAFEGAKFEPRPQWKEKVAPPPAPAPEEPLRAADVFAYTVEVDEQPVLVVRGHVRNITPRGYQEVTARIIVTDAAGKILGEQTVSSGTSISRRALLEAKSLDEVATLVIREQAGVDGHASAPFVAVFEQVPAKVLEGDDVRYRVELSGAEASEGS